MKLLGIELKGVFKVQFGNEWLKVYDEKGNTIYGQTSAGFWIKHEYDEKGNQVYWETSEGKVFDKRAKELTIEEIEKLLGYKIKIKGGNK